jgi:hypothetical protein
LSSQTWLVRCAPTPPFTDHLLSVEDVEQIAILAGIWVGLGDQERGHEGHRQERVQPTVPAQRDEEALRWDGVGIPVLATREELAGWKVDRLCPYWLDQMYHGQAEGASLTPGE